MVNNNAGCVTLFYRKFGVQGSHLQHKALIGQKIKQKQNEDTVQCCAHCNSGRNKNYSNFSGLIAQNYENISNKIF
jgi:hypothetical protein